MTLMNDNELSSLLGDHTTYNYAKHLLPLSVKSDLSDFDVKLLNTLELFSFGDWSHYLKYRDRYIALNSSQILKLIKLSILSLINDYEGYSISLDSITVDEGQYKLGSGIREFLSQAKVDDLITTDTANFLEQIIIDLKYDRSVDVKIDDFTNTLIIYEAFTLRDAYSDENYELRVLKKQDIPKRCVSVAINNLNDWLNDKIVPIKEEIDTIATKTEVTKERTVSSFNNVARKRKPSD